MLDIPLQLVKPRSLGSCLVKPFPLGAIQVKSTDKVIVCILELFSTTQKDMCFRQSRLIVPAASGGPSVLTRQLEVRAAVVLLPEVLSQRLDVPKSQKATNLVRVSVELTKRLANALGIPVPMAVDVGDSLGFGIFHPDVTVRAHAALRSS